MTRTFVDDVDLVIKALAQTAIDNTDYFSELDAVVGDGDFGYSLRNGFEIVISEFETIDRSSIGSYLRKVGMIMASKVGGSSGPIWGTAFLRAGIVAGERTELTGDDLIAMLRAGVEGIQERGGASLGEKTLLDALVPAIDSLEHSLANPGTAKDGGVAALQEAADVATQAALDTAPMLAMRGRAAYTGERSRGSVDAGATAVGVLLQGVSVAWHEKYSR